MKTLLILTSFITLNAQAKICDLNLVPGDIKNIVECSAKQYAKPKANYTCSFKAEPANKDSQTSYRVDFYVGKKKKNPLAVNEDEARQVAKSECHRIFGNDYSDCDLLMVGCFSFGKTFETDVLNKAYLVDPAKRP